MAYHRFKRLNTTLLLIFVMFIIYSVFFSSSSGFSNQLEAPKPITGKDAGSGAGAGADLVVDRGLLKNDKFPVQKEIAKSVDEGEKLVTKDDKPGKSKGKFDLSDTEIAFMPKMTNETLKLELGNAAWKLFHTILARYPVSPSAEQQEHLNDYISSFAKVYPCGDCARHFQKLLAKFPPQTSSRSAAAVWGCHVHNKVNAALKKPEYDCSHIIDDYECGCGEDEELTDFTLNGESIKSSELSEHMLAIELDSKEEAQLG